MSIQYAWEPVCSFMTVLYYSKAVVSSGQLSCQLAAILSVCSPADGTAASLGDEVFKKLCIPRVDGVCVCVCVGGI